jgi:hypothetical protein
LINEIEKELVLMKKIFSLLKANLIIVFFVPIIIPFFVFTRNYADTPVGVFFRAGLISFALFVILLIFSFLVLKNQNKAVIFSSISFVLLYEYGNLYYALVNAHNVLGHHKILGPLFFVFILFIFFLTRKIMISRNTILAIKVIACIFILFQIIQITPKIFTKYAETRLSNTATASSKDQIQDDIHPVKISDSTGTPDVYYIILDLYARNDLIQKDFSFDNSSFTDSLKKLGFYVDNCSRSNYMITENSVASSLNMDYLQELINSSTPKSDYTSIVEKLIKDPAVIRKFKSLGYKINSFQSGYDFTEITKVDQYLKPPTKIAFLGGIDPYENLLLRGSIFKILYDTHIPLIDTLFDKITFPYSAHVNLQYFILNNLPKIAKDPQPTFTFAHITIPHTPLIFRADGTYTTNRDYYGAIYDAPISNDLFNDGYINQVEFIDQKMLEIVKNILDNSSTPPIIIIQGDHGVNLNERLPNLNVYYLPGNGEKGLYSSISPVNSFRVIFDEYFNSDYPLLKDIGYSGLYDNPYEWKVVPEMEPDCLNQ